MTNSCNLRCKYCIGKECDNVFQNKLKYEVDYDIPDKIEYDVSDLKKFIEQDSNPVIILYGGEPLLEIDKLREVMDNIKAKYMLQTNGVLLKELGSYINRLHNVMFSIDGIKFVTNENRGMGVYEEVMRNAKWLRNSGFKGEILARMTATSANNMFRDVRFLLNFFDSVHWQLDCQFFPDYNAEKFTKWMKKYNKEVSNLVTWWVDEMENGLVHKIYPFVGIMLSLLRKEKKKLRCGAGHSQYAITTNGDIYACPVIAGIKQFKVGTIFDNEPNKLKEVKLSEPCDHCEALDECGGRCLYANKTKMWGSLGYEAVCSSVKTLLKRLKNELPRIEALIKNKTIKIEDFNFDEYNSCEIIP